MKKLSLDVIHICMQIQEQNVLNTATPPFFIKTQIYFFKKWGCFKAFYTLSKHLILFHKNIISNINQVKNAETLFDKEQDF